MMAMVSSLTWGVQTIGKLRRKWFDTAIKASLGHRENQSMVHPEIRPGNFSARERNFSPT